MIFALSFFLMFLQPMEGLTETQVLARIIPIAVPSGLLWMLGMILFDSSKEKTE